MNPNQSKVKRISLIFDSIRYTMRSFVLKYITSYFTSVRCRQILGMFQTTDQKWSHFDISATSKPIEFDIDAANELWRDWMINIFSPSNNSVQIYMASWNLLN